MEERGGGEVAEEEDWRPGTSPHCDLARGGQGINRSSVRDMGNMGIRGSVTSDSDQSLKWTM